MDLEGWRTQNNCKERAAKLMNLSVTFRVWDVCAVLLD